MEIVCFCHLRWNFVYQRPQHLLTRFAQHGPVHFWEEPVHQEREKPELAIRRNDDGVSVITALLPRSFTDEQTVAAQRELLNEYIAGLGRSEFVAWYYTPMALQFSDQLEPSVVVYDCMDELSAFEGAPRSLIDEERRLF